MQGPATAASAATVYLTREGSVFRMAFPYDKALVERMRALPYASFDRQTKSWTCMVCQGSVEQLRRLYYEGFTDVSVDDLLEANEELPQVRDAMLRAGSAKRPFVVHMATRDDRLYSRLQSIPGAQWDKSAQAISYPPQAAAALAELADRGVLDDENDLLQPADVVVTFDGRNGRFKILGDERAQPVFDRHFPGKDVVRQWQEKGIDVDFSDAFSQEVYEGELARVSDGVQPESMAIDLYPYQAVDVSFVLSRTGAGVMHQPGAGKCLRGEDRVWVDGQRVAIQDVWQRWASAETTQDPTGGEWAAANAELPVHTLGRDGKMRRVLAPRLFRQYVNETMKRVTLVDGQQITVTAAHKLLTEDGWTTGFAEGDRIAVPRRIHVEGEERDLELVELLAWQIGEGYESYPDATTQGARITQDNRAVLERVSTLAERVSQRYGAIDLTTCSIHESEGRSAEVRLWIRGWSAFLAEHCGYEYGHLSAGKRVPTYVETGDDDAARVFLRHFFAGEAHVNVNRMAVELSSASREMIDGLVHLLRRFGVWARVSHKRKAATNGHNITRDYWELKVSGRSLQEFIEHVGIADQGKQAALEQLRSETGNDNLDTFSNEPLRALVTRHGIPRRRMGVAESAGYPGRRITHSTVATLQQGAIGVLDGSLEREIVQRRDAGGTGSHNHWDRKTLAALRALDEARFVADLEDLWMRADADVVWVAIDSIEDVEHEGWVYDLEVPVSHNLVVEGIVAHNTAIAIGAGCELLDRGEVPRVVFICPSSIRTQVGKEIVRFTRFDEDDVVVIGGSKKNRHEAYERAETAKFLVVHYDVLSRDYQLLRPLCAGAFLIFDEAHKCFPAGTDVLTTDGLVAINDIVEGDLRPDVWAFDEAEGRFVVKQVTGGMRSQTDKPIVRVTHAAGALDCTVDHPLLTAERGWVPALSLSAGETLLRPCDDDPSRAEHTTVLDVEAISAPGATTTVYNLEVEELHNYVADGILVHNCKNPKAKRTKSAKKLAKVSARRVVMTGTPVENDPGEWYSVLGQLAVPGSLGTPHEFFNRYQFPGRFGGYEGARNLPELRQRSAVHYTRRLKSEIAEHLPPLRVQRVMLDPDPSYAAALRRAHREARDEIAKGRVEKAINRSDGVLFGDDVAEAEAGAEMTAVGMLRAMCSSPRLLAMSDSEAAKAMDEAGLIVDSDGPKLDELRSLAIELRWTREQRLERMAEQGRANADASEVTGERMVLFTYSRKMADLIAERLAEDGISHRTYHGGTSQDERDAAVELFTDPDADITALVCTDAAAEGLNLGRCCNLLVNFDVPWNPSTLIQRGNRIHRVDGTASSYLVLNYTVAGTIENGILRMLERKADLSDAILGETGGRAATTGRSGNTSVSTLLAEAFEDLEDSGEHDADGRVAA